MKPVRLSIAPAVADANGIAQAQTATGGGALTLNGALSGTMDVPRHVSITATGNESAITFTVAGTDRFGNSITEAVTGPNATTVKGSKNFKTVTSVTPSGAVSSPVEVGSADELETQWVQVNHRAPVGTVQMELSSASGMTYALQTTADDVQASGFQENDAAVTVDGTMTGKVISTRSSDTGYAVAARIAVTGFSTGSAVATFIQGSAA